MRLIKQFLLGLSVLGLMLSPLAVSASYSFGQSNPQTNLPGAAGQGMAGQNFCTRITNTKSDILTRLTNAENNRGSVRLDILGKLQDRKTQRADQIQKVRDDAKNKFEDLITKLEGQATTDAQKAAVASFKTSVEGAMTTRQTAIDAAVTAYETGLTTLIGNREDVIKTAAATFKTAVTTAIGTAQTACAASNPDSGAIRTTFMASLKSANEAFRSAVQVKVDGVLKQQLEALVKTRNDAFKAANDAFKTTIQSARDTLKAAFPSA